MSIHTEYNQEEEAAWPLVQNWISQATNPVEILPVNKAQAVQVLHDVQGTTQSLLGAIISQTGGVLVDHGWLRILGSGHERLTRTLSSWNGLDKPGIPHRISGAFLIADDAIGGFFVLNGGAFESPAGHVHYFAPDTLEWEDMGKTYTDFFGWACSGDLDQFFLWRWPGWENETNVLTGGQGIAIYPPLWASGPWVQGRSRRTAPIDEMWHTQLYFAASLGDIIRSRD